MFIIDSVLLPRTSVRGAPAFIKASVCPPCEWRLKWYSNAPSRVCQAILELSLHPFCSCPRTARLHAPGQDSDALRSSVSIALLVRVTLTVNAFVLEQGLHCASLGENKIPETQS